MDFLTLNTADLAELDKMIGDTPFKYAVHIAQFLQRKYAEQNAQKATNNAGTAVEKDEAA